MRHLKTAVCVAIVVAAWGLANSLEAQSQQPPRPAAQLRANIENVYISDFRIDVGLSEEQMIKVVPFLRSFVQNRFTNAQERQALVQRRNDMISQNPSEDEVRLLNDQILQRDRQKLNIEMRFQNMLDPELTPTQRLKARTFQDNFEQRMLRLIAAARASQEAQQAIQNQRQQQRQQNNPPARPQQNNPATFQNR